MTYRRQFTLTIALLLIGMTLGCSDDRLVEMAERSAQRQQEQNELVAHQSEAMIQETQRITEAAKEIVAKDAASRREMISAQKELHSQLSTERSSIDRQREDLEQQRQRIAAARERAPIVAEAIRGAGILVACLLPLLVAAYALSRLDHGRGQSEELGELLLVELTSEHPRLLPIAQPPAAGLLTAPLAASPENVPRIESAGTIQSAPPF